MHISINKNKKQKQKKLDCIFYDKLVPVKNKL